MEEHFRKAFSYPPPDVIHPAQAIGRSSEDPPIRSIDDGIIPAPDRHTNVDDSEDPGSLVDMAAGGISTRIRSPTPTTNDNSGVHKFLGETSGSITGFSAVNSISNPSFGVTSPSAISTAAQNVGYQFPVSSGISTLESAHIPPVAIYGHGFPGSKAPNTPPTTRSVVSPVSMVKKLAGEYSASITGPKFGHSMFSETAQKIVADTPLTQTEHSSLTLLPWPNHDAQVQGEMNAITAGPNTTIPSVQTGPATNTHTPTPNLTASQNAEVEMEDRIIIKQEWPTLQDAMRSFLSPQPPSGRLGSLQPENEIVARDFYGTAQKSATAQIQTYAATPPRSIDPGFIESGSQISTDISLPAPTITTSVSSGSAQNDAAAEIAEQSARFSSPLSDLSEKDMKFEDIDDSQTIQVATVTTTPRSTRKATQQVKGTRGRRNSAPGMTKTNTLSSGPVGSLTTTQTDTIPIDIDTEDAGRTAARSISNDQFGIFRAVDQVPDQSTPNKRSRRGKNVANSSSARQAPSGSDPNGGPARNTRKRKQPPVTPAAPTLAASRPARTAAIRAREVIHDVATGRRSRSSTAEPKEEEKPELSVLPPTKRRKTNRDRSNTPDTKLPKVEELEKKSEQGSSVPALRKTTRTRRQTQTFPPQPPPTATPRRATRSAGMITTTDTGSGSSIQVETTPPEDVIMTTETGTGNSMKVETALLKAVITTTETESGSSVQVKTTPLEDMNQKPVSPTQCEERPNSPSPHRLVEVRTPQSPAQHKEVQLKSPSATLQKEGEQKSSSIQHVEEVPKSPSSPQQEEEKQESPSLALQAEGIQKSPSPILQVAEIPKPSSPIQQEKVHQRSPPPKPASPTQQLLQEANVPRTGQPVS